MPLKRTTPDVLIAGSPPSATSSPAVPVSVKPVPAGVTTRVDSSRPNANPANTWAGPSVEPSMARIR